MIKRVVKRVTIIEDSRETQIRLLESVPATEIVEMQAITVDPFFDEEIEKAIGEFNPNIIILDLRLTRTEDSGFRVLRKLKESSLRDIPVIVCSKYISHKSNDENRKKAMLYGADDALPKIPFPTIQDFFDVTEAKRKNEANSSDKKMEGGKN